MPEIYKSNYKLKNCPFCNRSPFMHGVRFGGRTIYWIQCKCGVQIRGAYNEKNVVDRWNQRFRGRPGEKRVKIDMRRPKVEEDE